MEDDLGAAAKGLRLVAGDGEVATSLRLPAVLLVVVVLRDDLDLVGDEVGGVEADTELTNHGHVSLALSDRLHEVAGARASDRS